MTSREPKFDELADEKDTLGWDRAVHGKFVDFAVSEEDEIETVTLFTPVKED